MSPARNDAHFHQPMRVWLAKCTTPVYVLATHQARADQIGAEALGPDTPFQLLRVQRKERTMPHGIPPRDLPHPSLIDLRRKAAAEQAKPAAEQHALQPAIVDALAKAESFGYERGLIDGRTGSASSVLLGVVLGAILMLVVLGAWPEAVTMLLPAGGYSV